MSTAGERIRNDGSWERCWICRDVFQRETKTRRYCASCDSAFCEGDHGSFAGGRGLCLGCDTRLED